jgi:hypothetical protein
MRRLRTLGDSLEAFGGSVLYRTDVLVGSRRRFNCQTQHRTTWDERAHGAVALLRCASGSQHWPDLLRIADLGCGNQRLRQCLSQGLGRPFEYVGYDLLPQSEDVVRLDVERELPSYGFDIVFCLGLLEYLRDVGSFARRLREVCRFAVTSYVVANRAGGLSRAQRRRHGWRTDYGEA